VIVKQIPTLLKLMAACSVSACMIGCGSDEPAPVTPEKFAEAQEKQRQMLQKEYGPGAGKAPKAVKTARTSRR